ncbi:MAG: hypothetical protein EOP22_17110 [Hyphomicrobiales bacterium]|nr:MAG: hypothetical protein EOP22_17110 [Hyphomicrobiales bacterium]
MTVSLSNLDVAWSLLGQQRYSEAAVQAAAILARFPDNVSALACHALANWQGGGDFAASMQEMRRAVELAPNEASVRHNFATMLASDGDIANACAQFETALRLKPDDTLAFYGLSHNHKFTEETPLVRSMLALHAAGELDPYRREFLAFALAKVFDDLGAPERAVHYALEGKAIAPRPFDLTGETRTLARLAQLAADDAFRKVRYSGHPSRAPLFIVGMNRSGTTLLESMLSRHPRVFAQGEQMQIIGVESAARQQAGGADRQSVAASLRKDWLGVQAERILQGAMARAKAPFDIVTDKLPENALRLGLISRIFPNARVIYVRRHPLDMGVSNFFQRFTHGQGYSYRMEWIGARVRQIADTMAIWKRAIDLPILDVSYEKLVADPEAEIRRVLNFVDLDWTADVLEPHRTQRAILTSSQWQVRQPVNRRSVGRWKAYEPWLGPMVEAMGGLDWVEREVAEASG